MCATAVAGIDIIAGNRELAAVDDLRGRIGIQTALQPKTPTLDAELKAAHQDYLRRREARPQPR